MARRSRPYFATTKSDYAIYDPCSDPAYRAQLAIMRNAYDALPKWRKQLISDTAYMTRTKKAVRREEASGFDPSKRTTAEEACAEAVRACVRTLEFHLTEMMERATDNKTIHVVNQKTLMDAVHLLRNKSGVSFDWQFQGVRRRPMRPSVPEEGDIE